MDKPTMTPAEVGEILGRGQLKIEEGLRKGIFPFGVAIPPDEGGQWAYIIPRKAFEYWFERGLAPCFVSDLPN